jgi:hypothetical protein
VLRTVVSICVSGLLLVSATACSKKEEKAIPQPCQRVEQSFKDLIRIPRAAAVKAPGHEGIWFVAGPNGSLWMTNGDPTDDQQDASTTLPLNDEARAASFIGGGVKAGSDAFQGTDEKEARRTAVDKCALG